MVAIARDLPALHAILQELRDVKDALARGPRQIKARENILQQKRQEQAAAEALHLTNRKAADAKGLDLKSFESRIANMQVKLNQASSNKEFDAIKSQMAADNMAKSVLEDEILELMDRTEAAAAQIVAAKASVQAAAADLERVTREFEQVAADLQAKVVELQQKVAESTELFPAEIRANYTRLVNSKGADAMAAVEGTHCGGCNSGMTSQQLIQIRTGTFKFCSSCGALLYIA